jgi:hypothetical protein
MAHVVKSALVIARCEGNQLVYLYSGTVVPDNVLASEVARLSAEGFLVEVPELEPVVIEVDPLAGLDLAGLTSYAEAKGIDLGRASSEDGIRAKIVDAEQV